MTVNPIILIDSGIGGASILKELLHTKGYSDIEYLADQKHFPYGNKSASWITKRMKELANWAKTRNPSCVVIACNTATSQSIKLVREILDVPVVGLDPVIKPLSKFTKPLLLATNGTISSDRTRELKSDKNISSYSPSKLTIAIENIDEPSIKNEIKELKNLGDFDAIGLSCTHYPLAKDVFSEVFPNANIIDPSEAVVNQIKKVCPPNIITRSTINWYTTGQVVRLKNQIKKYMEIDTNPIKLKI